MLPFSLVSVGVYVKTLFENADIGLMDAIVQIAWQPKQDLFVRDGFMVCGGPWLSGFDSFAAIYHHMPHDALSRPVCRCRVVPCTRMMTFPG